MVWGRSAPTIFFFVGKGIHLQGVGQWGPSPGCSPPTIPLSRKSAGCGAHSLLPWTSCLHPCILLPPPSPSGSTVFLCHLKVMGESVNRLVRYFIRDLTGHCSPLFSPKHDNDDSRGARYESRYPFCFYHYYACSAHKKKKTSAPRACHPHNRSKRIIRQIFLFWSPKLAKMWAQKRSKGTYIYMALYTYITGKQVKNSEGKNK